MPAPLGHSLRGSRIEMALGAFVCILFIYVCVVVVLARSAVEVASETLGRCRHHRAEKATFVPKRS